MAILYADDPADAAAWAAAIRALAPGVDLRFWPDFGASGGDRLRHRRRQGAG